MDSKNFYSKELKPKLYFYQIWSKPNLNPNLNLKINPNLDPKLKPNLK